MTCPLPQKTTGRHLSAAPFLPKRPHRLFESDRLDITGERRIAMAEAQVRKTEDEIIRSRVCDTVTNDMFQRALFELEQARKGVRDLCYCVNPDLAHQVAGRIRSLGYSAEVERREVGCWVHHYIIVPEMQAGEIATKLGYPQEPMDD